MPGTIRVSVLEAVDLLEVLTDGPFGKDVTAKVTLGPKLFKTQPGTVADSGTIASWNSDFAFPVMNLRDKLVISICDSEDQSVTQTAIEIPSIIQKGSRDEFVALNKGGRIHLRLSFVLTEEERKRIEIMRVAALKRKQEADSRQQKKSTVIIQPIITPETELVKKSPTLSSVVIEEVSDIPTTGPEHLKDATITDGKIDDATTVDDKVQGGTILGDMKENLLPEPPGQAKPLFNYAKAIGMPPSAKKAVTKKPRAAVSDSSPDELKAEICAVDSNEVEMSSKAEVSVEVPGSGDGAAAELPKPAENLDSTELGVETSPSLLPETPSTRYGGGETDMDSETRASREGDSEEAEYSFDSEDEFSWLLLSPIDSACCEVHSLHPPRRRSGSVSSKPVKRTLSRSRGSARVTSKARVSSYYPNSPAPLSPDLVVEWVQDRVRRALSNFKGCCQPSTTTKC